MKRTEHPLDEFFREVLHDHHYPPSETAKNTFLKEATEVIRRDKRKNRWVIYLPILVALVASGTAGYFLFRESNHNPSVSSTPLSRQTTLGGRQPEISVNTASQQNLTASQQTSVVHTSNAGPKISQSAGHQLVSFPSEESSNKVDENIAVPVPGTEHPEQQSMNTGYVATVNDTSRFLKPPEEPFTEPSSTIADSAAALKIEDNPEKSGTIFPDTTISLQNRLKEKSVKPGSRQKDWNILTGFYYTPEWMFNTLEGEKFVNNFGVEGTFRYQKYSLRTGVGLSITKGTNELVVEYQDYLGAYKALDSMSFAWDEKHYHLLPTYYMSDQEVWDSLMKLDYPNVIKQYTYLQIPFILGYDFWRNEHISFGLRAGPVLSVLLKSRQISENYDPGKNRIIRANQITPDRIQVNWQLLGGLNATFQLSRRFCFELEPSVRYYFNSVYEPSDISKKPWSLGVRTAFLIQF